MTSLSMDPYNIVIIIIMINKIIIIKKKRKKKTLFNEAAYLTVVNLPQGPQKHKQIQEKQL